MTLDLSEHALGLTTDRLRHVHHLLNDYDPNLSLRRIPDGDPILAWAMAQDPPRRFGVWEASVDRSVVDRISNWVFTIAEQNIDDRVFARVLEGDFTRHGASELMAKKIAFDQATELSAKRKFIQTQEERRDQMMFIGQSKQSVLRMKIHGEDVVIGDDVRAVRTHIS